MASSHARTKIATDGGSIAHKQWYRAGGWGLAFEAQGRIIQAGGRLSGMDETSYMAELVALQRALAIVDAALVSAHIIIDHWAVCMGAKHLQNGGKPIYNSFRIWLDIQK